MTELAPIAFFAYNRPDHTLRSLTSLSQCELAAQSHLYIFCEGAKTLNDREPVLKVREIAGSRQWCGKVDIIVRERNFGCARSLISGITTVCEKHGRVIIVEDDLIVSSHFLQYMNRGLEKYQEEESVMQISGYMFPVSLKAQTDAIFLPIPLGWGWATWQRAWKHHDPLMPGYAELKRNETLIHKFNLYGGYDYFTLLEHTVNGKVDTWDIGWYLTTFLRGGLSLQPVKSLVHNVGFDGSGTHCGLDQCFNNSELADNVVNFPNVDVDTQCFEDIITFLKNISRNTKITMIIWSTKNVGNRIKNVGNRIMGGMLRQTKRIAHRIRGIVLWPVKRFARIAHRGSRLLFTTVIYVIIYYNKKRN